MHCPSHARRSAFAIHAGWGSLGCRASLLMDGSGHGIVVRSDTNKGGLLPTANADPVVIVRPRGDWGARRDPSLRAGDPDWLEVDKCGSGRTCPERRVWFARIRADRLLLRHPGVVVTMPHPQGDRTPLGTPRAVMCRDRIRHRMVRAAVLPPSSVCAPDARHPNLASRASPGPPAQPEAPRGLRAAPSRANTKHVP